MLNISQSEKGLKGGSQESSGGNGNGQLPHALKLSTTPIRVLTVSDETKRATFEMTKVPQFKASGQENSFWDYSILLTMWKIWSLGAPEEWHKTVTATSFSGIWRTLWPTSVSQNRPKVSVSCWRLYTASPGVFMRRINCDSATVNISFLYIFRWKPWDWESWGKKSWKVVRVKAESYCELGPVWESKSSCWSSRHVYRLDESKRFILSKSWP